MSSVLSLHVLSKGLVCEVNDHSTTYLHEEQIAAIEITFGHCNRHLCEPQSVSQLESTSIAIETTMSRDHCRDSNPICAFVKGVQLTVFLFLVVPPSWDVK